MRTILVLNSKGGSGKTTLATNLASFYASRGKNVALVDCDRQASALDWLDARPDSRPPIMGFKGWEGRVRVPGDTEYAIIDAPAALHGRALTALIDRAQTLLLPVLPSPLDLRAAVRFHGELLRIGAVLQKQVTLATVANRIRENSPTRQPLEELLQGLSRAGGVRLPFVAYLRNSQNYLRAAERGLGIGECAPSMVAHDVKLWQPLLRWLESPASSPAP